MNRFGYCLADGLRLSAFSIYSCVVVQTQKVAKKVSAVLAALVRVGFVDSPDGGRTFLLRRAA